MSTNANSGPLVKSRKRSLVSDTTTDLNSSGHRPQHPKKKLRTESTFNSSSLIAVLRERDVNSNSQTDIRNDGTTEVGKSYNSQEAPFDVHSIKHKPFSLSALVRQHLVKNSSIADDSDIVAIEKLVKAEDIATVLSRRGWWTSSILELFAETSIVEISLSKSLSMASSAAPMTVLGVFMQQLKTFECLQTLSLSRVSISLKDISCLRMLPCIKVLDLAATHLTTKHLLHLATHADTLERLNIASNPNIDDDARVPLSALPQLRTISLRDTSITLPCLRLLVYVLPQTCRFMTLPAGALEHLNSRTRRYSIQIPQDYCSDPRQIADLNMGALKRNLEFHKRSNNDVIITGSKAEMVARLTGIVCNRVADERIAKRVGRG